MPRPTGIYVIYVTTWEILPHELVHYLLDRAELEEFNNEHLHPGFAHCGGPEWRRWQ